MPKKYTHDTDDDRTDELPSLVAGAAAVGQRTTDDPGWWDDTGEHTALFAPGHADPAAAAAATGMAGLEAEVERWSARCRAAEQELADKNLLVADLDGAMAAARRSLESHKQEAARLTAQLAERAAALEAAVADNERLRERLGAVAQEADAEPPSPPSADSAELREALEDRAALAAYVDGRKESWDRMQREIATLATKVVALEHELRVRSRRLADAESRADRESRRAADLRTLAIDYARQARERATPQAPPAAEKTPAAAAEARSQSPPTDVMAQLEAEIAHKRQQVAAQLAQLQERDERLRAATEELTRLRAELAARDARIASLQRELDERLGALQKLNAMDLSLQGLEAKIAGRLATPAADAAPPAPALLCLTGDAPQRIALGSANIVGRGSHCDVQIRTHYVSREHARIVVTADGSTIEDLGSRNGVFVNAVKVDRQRLHQGDLIEIGETQFRYVESVAH
jgi:chromosome segregation ATPase